MDLSKHIDFFNPNDVDAPIHIIGVGAMGSWIAHHLVRLGVTELVIYDFDTVDEYNITNQLFKREHIGKPKTDMLIEELKTINPSIKVKVYDKGYVKQMLSGHVFLAVDNIELRQQIVNNNLYNNDIKSMYDCRMRLTDAQSYACDWSTMDNRKKFLATMDFTEEEATEATPVSACGTTLSVTPTVIVCTCLTVSNFINFIKDKELKTIILLDAFSFNINAF